MGIPYTSKVHKIINYTIKVTNAWEQAANAVPTARGWFIKANNDTDNAFDLAYEDSPSSFLTNDGPGFTFDQRSLPDVWVRGSKDTKIEIHYDE